MINVSMQVRRAISEDHSQIAALGTYESNTHRHLDWRSPLDWIGFPNYWVLEQDGLIIAALACPEEPPRVAWIRLFGYHSQLSGAEAWSLLWNVAYEEILNNSKDTQIAAIIGKQWFQKILLSSGFELKQNIVLLQLPQENISSFAMRSQIQIRLMREADMPSIEKIDLQAFGYFWHNTFDVLSRARSQAVVATVAEDPSGVIGYQISTGNSLGAHLARLGVQPEAQGRGVGTALVSDLIQRLGGRQLGRLSVNTQADNAASLALYKKFGFLQTGEHYPVLVYPMNIQ